VYLSGLYFSACKVGFICSILRHAWYTHYFLQVVSLSPFRSLHQLFIFTLSTITFVVRDRRQTACFLYLVLYCLNVYDLEIPNHICVKCFSNCRSMKFHLLTNQRSGFTKFAITNIRRDS